MCEFQEVSFEEKGLLLCFLPLEKQLGHDWEARAKDGEPQLEESLMVTEPLYLSGLLPSGHHFLERVMNL